MSFLQQLKNQARALQSQRLAEDEQLAARAARTEQACRSLHWYLQDLAPQLSVIQPEGPALTLDGRTPWPAMKLVDFRVDARRKVLRGREVFDYVAMGWRIVPREGERVRGVVSVNFPTDMQRVVDRLAMGPVEHERIEVRDPARKNALQEVRYEYVAQTRGSVSAYADHDTAQLRFRLLNTSGFEIVHSTVAADRLDNALLDELAKRVAGQPSLFH